MIKRVSPTLVCVLSLVLLVMLAGPCHAFSGDATDDAFAALFSMPGAGPETGEWRFEVPEDFEVENETQLIAYLARKQKAGADFNAYRHFGTLLHHAIRSGKTKTALWLLEHGADPRKTLKGGSENALTLSQNYQRSELAKVLRDKYALHPPPAAPVPATHAAKPSPDYATPADQEAARTVLRSVTYALSAGGDPARARQYQAETLKNWTSLVAALPPGAYGRIVDDDEALSDLLFVQGRNPAGLDKTLSSLPPALLKRRAPAAVAGLARQARRRAGKGDNADTTYSLSPEHWHTLWKHLDLPVDYGGQPDLAGKLQPELWPELFASGYANHGAESALGCMLAEIGAAELKAIWPRLEAHFPDIREAAPGMVLNHYRMSGSSECWSWNAGETQEKLRYLSSLGIRQQLDGFDTGQLRDQPPELLAAMAPFLRDASTLPPAPRLVDAKPGCSFAMTAPWYRALLHTPVVTGKDEIRVMVEAVQLLQIPGEVECALLVGGFTPEDPYDSGPFDSFTGPYREPYPSCPDPMDRYEVWHNVQGRIERLEIDLGHDGGDGSLHLVKDRSTSHLYYVSGGSGPDRCRARAMLPYALEWQRVGTGWTLSRTGGAMALEPVLFDQCSYGENGLHCRGIAGIGAASESGQEVPTRAEAYQGMELQSFIDVYRGEQRQAYLDAIQRLDKPRLKELQAEGIPGAWTAQAIRQISASSLPLQYRRKRIAWIFHEHAQLARVPYDESMLEQLLDWLPREDWGPLLSLRRISRVQAAKHGDERLACTIDRGNGLNCGETWSE